MPASGRDVQCSNCGQTWFQHHPDHMPDEENKTDDAAAPDEETAPPPPPPPNSPPPKPERKQLDPAVADILRQEAEAEKAARRSAQPSTLESQPDLGLDMEEPASEGEAERRAREARDRMARLRGSEQRASETVAPDVTAAATTGSRRDLLPDIEEINSTLRSGSPRTSAGAADIGPDIEAPTYQRQKRGFRTGFLTMLLIFGVLTVLYVVAPRLAVAVPALKGPLTGYVYTVDQGRIWLDSKVQGILQSLDAMAAGDS